MSRLKDLGRMVLMMTVGHMSFSEEVRLCLTFRDDHRALAEIGKRRRYDGQSKIRSTELALA